MRDRPISLHGILEYVTFYNPRNHYTVARLKTTAPAALITVTGLLPEAAAGTTVRLSGKWTEHPKYGRQFQFDSAEIILPETAAGIRDYLASGIIKGIGPSLADKIVCRFSADTLRVMETGPHELTTVNGIGPKTAERAVSCIRHLVQETAGQGHAYIDEDELIEHAERLFEINRTAVSEALETLCDAGEIIMESDDIDSGPPRIFPEWLHTAETTVARRIRAMQSIPAVLPSASFANLLANIENRLILSLSPEQQQILEEMLRHRVAVISGGPGTGKTTIVRAITEMFQQSGNRVCLAAPTGRSARRMTEITGFAAHTIHKLLEYNLEQQCFGKDMDNPIEADILIVDEASMIDTALMHHLMAAVPLSTRLILVGDADQLPSICPGNLLADLIVSDTIPVYFLKTVFRQDAESRIIANAHRILNGELPAMTQAHDAIDADAEFVFIEQHDPVKVTNAIIDLCTYALPEKFTRDPLKTIQVLTPVHKGPAGTIALNQALQTAFNSGSPVVSNNAQSFKIGDKVMHLKNNYKKEVFNGDIGIITAWDDAAETLTVAFEDRLVDYAPDELDELALGYAISVHKSQGSEYPVVMMPLITRHYVMLQRNLLYTAITRAKNLVILIGTQKALSLALANDRPRMRRSGLAQRLKAD